MTKREVLNIIKEYVKETKNHACYDEGAEYGIYPCCNEVDYHSHKPDCIHTKIDQALQELVQIEESERLTLNEICNIVHNLIPDTTGIPIATAIIEAQRVKKQRRR